MSFKYLPFNGFAFPLRPFVLSMWDITWVFGVVLMVAWVTEKVRKVAHDFPSVSALLVLVGIAWPPWPWVRACLVGIPPWFDLLG